MQLLDDRDVAQLVGYLGGAAGSRRPLVRRCQHFAPLVGTRRMHDEKAIDTICLRHVGSPMSASAPASLTELMCNPVCAAGQVGIASPLVNTPGPAAP